MSIFYKGKQIRKSTWTSPFMRVVAGMAHSQGCAVSGNIDEYSKSAHNLREKS